MKKLVCLTLMSALSAALFGACGGGGPAVSDGEIDAVCASYADVIYALDCAPKQFTKQQFQSACAYQGNSLQEHCGQEFVDAYQCLGDGGYTCLNGNAYPNMSCIKEQTAFQECSQALPCKDLCAEAAKESCEPMDCEAGCLAEQKELNTCGLDYSQLLSCQAQNFTCENGKPSVKGCEEEVGTIAWCLGTFKDDECEGYCWAADKLGCGAGCAEDCHAKLGDAQCGNSYRNVLQCAVDLSELNVECVSGAPAATSECSSQMMEYEACKAGGV